MTARHALVVLFVAALGMSAIAQQPTPKPPPTPQAPAAPTPQAPPPANPPAQAPRPEPNRQPINVRIEVTITDQRGTAPVMKKTITAVTGDQLNARIRTQAEFQGIGGNPLVKGIPLNLDVMPTILPNGRVRVTVGLEYHLPAPPDEPAASGPRLVGTGIQENLSVNLDDGKPLVVSQSADPVSDRQVTVEVRATILK
jgi:hypothetical protein